MDQCGLLRCLASTMDMHWTAPAAGAAEPRQAFDVADGRWWRFDCYEVADGCVQGRLGISGLGAASLRFERQTEPHARRQSLGRDEHVRALGRSGGAHGLAPAETTGPLITIRSCVFSLPTTTS